MCLDCKPAQLPGLAFARGTGVSLEHADSSVFRFAIDDLRSFGVHTVLLESR
jgi:hypothetical protein